MSLIVYWREYRACREYSLYHFYGFFIIHRPLQFFRSRPQYKIHVCVIILRRRVSEKAGIAVFSSWNSGEEFRINCFEITKDDSEK